MQSELLDILILGLFVVLFGSIYRKRAGGRLRFWVTGWLLALMAMTASMAHSASSWSQHAGHNFALCALLLSGICFLLSASPIVEDRWLCALVASFLGLPGIFYIFYAGSGVHTLPLYFAAAACGAGGTVLAWSVYRRSPHVLATITLTFLAGEICTFYAIFHHRGADGVSILLAEIFLSFAALYWFDFRRFTAGVVTTVAALLAWSATFPLSALCHCFFPAATAFNALWNLPMYFVAFGMILTLLEDEIYAAGKTGEHYRLLFADSPHPMWIHDPETLRFLKVNDAAVAQYGYSREEFLSLRLDALSPREELAAVLRETAGPDSFALHGPWRHLRKDGSEIQVDIAVHAIDFRGRSCRFVLVQDVTERQRLHGQLVYQAHHDSLTGLPNRILLEDRIQQSFARASRDDHRAAVLCLDLDRFKQINDTYGHTAGDQCLQEVARRITTRLRAVDTVARIGGEEFIVILGELDGMRDAEVVARDLLATVHEPLLAAGHSIQASASMGIAIYPDDGTASAELWRAADNAMYEAKHRGGNQYFFVSTEVAAGEEGALEPFMRRMLDQGGFEMAYQPVYSIAGDLCGLEAMVKLDHPRLGSISPDRFLPAAEESGLILPLGDWMLNEVCRQSAEWQSLGQRPIRIGFHVSPALFTRSDFSSQVMLALAQYELDPLLLEIGVGESTVMSNLPEVARQMRTLAAVGVRFSVDGFGTGYSPLRHLHQLPISSLKIDRSFIERISSANGTCSIVQAIVALGHSLGLAVTAEGVEHDDQLRTLHKLGCDFLQGRLFAPPMSASRVLRHLSQPSANIPARKSVQAVAAGD
jgi:diguanylate cyclase (GGDEF)-like protein/PAS domain S-box-containing protein